MNRESGASGRFKAAAAVMAACVSATAFSGEARWEHSEVLLAQGSASHNGYLSIALAVTDYPASYPVYSASLHATVYDRDITAANASTFHYSCTFLDLKDAAVSRLPDHGAWLAPNSPLSVTIELPACDNQNEIYAAATLTVECAADDTVHRDSNGGYRQTNADGSHELYKSFEKIQESFFDASTGEPTCTLTFDNGAVTLVDYSADVTARAYRNRRK